MTVLEIFQRKGWVNKKRYEALAADGKELAAMIKGLIN